MIGLYVYVFVRLTWAQQSNYGTFGFDMGVFDQEIWLFSRFKDPFITLRGLNAWANHVNPNVYLLVPFYWLGGGPHLLFVFQTVAIAAGAVPLWLLARDRLADPWLALAFPAAWLLYPAVEWATWWHFHPETLAITPLLFAWWLASRGHWRWFAVCVVLILFAKEDAALVVMALGVVVALRLSRRPGAAARLARRAGAVTVAAGLAWLAVCLKVILPLATGAGNPFYANQFPDLGNSTNQIVYNAVRHPSRILGLALRHDRHDYYLKMLAPVAGLALAAPAVLAIALPAVIVNIANNQGYPHDYRYQYQAFVSAAVFLASIEAVARWRSVAWRAALIGAMCVSALAANIAWSPSPLDGATYRGVWTLHSSAHLRAIDAALRRVPATAGVAASYNIDDHLTHRVRIYEWPNPFMRVYYGLDDNARGPDPNRVQYLVIDEGLNTPEAPLLAALTAPGGQFEVLSRLDGVMLAHRVRPGPVPIVAAAPGQSAGSP
jgi:uncharacterized membrane protein